MASRSSSGTADCVNYSWGRHELKYHTSHQSGVCAGAISREDTPVACVSVYTVFFNLKYLSMYLNIEKSQQALGVWLLWKFGRIWPQWACVPAGPEGSAGQVLWLGPSGALQVIIPTLALPSPVCKVRSLFWGVVKLIQFGESSSRKRT